MNNYFAIECKNKKFENTNYSCIQPEYTDCIDDHKQLGLL